MIVWGGSCVVPYILLFARSRVTLSHLIYNITHNSDHSVEQTYFISGSSVYHSFSILSDDRFKASSQNDAST